MGEKSREPGESPGKGDTRLRAGLAFLFLLLSQSPLLAQGPGTGIDPRDFSDRLMPYQLYMSLDSDMKIDETHIFGLKSVSPQFAFTYDLPLARNVEWDTEDSGFPADVEATGVGDLNLRFLTPLGKAQLLGMSWLLGGEVNLPTHSDGALGPDQVTGGPTVVNVWDMAFLPGAFLAMSHTVIFDLYGDRDEDDVALYTGRWTITVPLHERYGIYSSTEIQPVYDFEDSDFSLWVGIEFGRTLKWGPVYVKPGFGVGNDRLIDREVTFEVGFRYFM